MPDVQGAEYLLQHLENMGWFESGGMGGITLSFKEINAYMQSMDIPLTRHEILILRRMSSYYLSYSGNKDPSTKMPYTTN